MKKYSLPIFLLVVFSFSSSTLLSQQVEAIDTITSYHHALELSPISPAMHIYAIQYAYRPNMSDELMLGFSYADIPQKAATTKDPEWMKIIVTPNTRTKDVGINHSWTIYLGYKRYIWKNWHLEYQLWPGYNSFYSITDNKYYNGFDLWNEFRIGHTFDFDIAAIPFYINLQYLVGFGLVKGNKPADFGKEGDQVFRAPVFFLGWRF
jgi:hypothetical protein